MKMHPATITRRQLLKRGGVLAAATVLGPTILPRSLFGADAPSNKITLGFIGMGIQNRDLLRAFIGRSDTRVLAVCDVDSRRRAHAKTMVETHYAYQLAKGSYQGCAAYRDFRELLARNDLDGVVIATPDHWHAAITIAAVKAGKDIYCEKPLSHSIREGRAMVNAVRANRRILQVGSMQRSSREFRAACELIRNGVLGKVDKVDVAVGGPPNPCQLPAESEEPGLDWDFWLGPAPTRPYNSILSPRGVFEDYPHWRDYREYGGGGVCDWGAHHFDIVQWAFGFDETGPTEILAASQDNAQSGVRLRYSTGLEVTHLPGNGITFFGSRGKLYVNRGAFKLWLGAELKTDDVGECGQVLKEMLPANAVRLYNSSNHLTDWLDSIRTRKPPICNAETGHRTATVCHLINLAYQHAQSLEWNPMKEQFVGGSGDAAWLDCEHRSSWPVPVG